MSYTVWLYVANEDEADSDPVAAEWSVMSVEGITREGAVEAAETVVDALRSAGYSPERVIPEDDDE